MLALTLPHRTWAHRVPAWAKLAALAAATPALLSAGGPTLAATAAAVAGLHLALGPDLRFAAARAGLRMLRPLVPMAALILAWHGATGRLAQGAEISLRMAAAVGLANLVTMTTRLDDIASVAERLAAPLRRLGVPPRLPGMALALVVRFTPALAARGAELGDAWRARSARRPNWRIVAPFCIAALDDAERAADALRARGGLLPAPEARPRPAPEARPRPAPEAHTRPASPET